MLSGRPPFAGRTVAETLMRVSAPDAADLGPVMAAGGQAYLGVLRRALAKDRMHRFQSADEFAAAVQAVSSRHAAVDAQATIVMPSHVLAPALPAPAWDQALLQRVEQHLVKFVGPMGRLMVMRTAQETTSPEALYARLARSLPNAADRSLFLRAIGGGRVEPTLGGRDVSRTMGTATMAPKEPGSMAPQTVSPAAMTLGGAVKISAEAAAAAQAALVRSIRPIACVLVRDAAAKATSGRDFIDLLCTHVTTPDELAALRRRLRAEVESKLV